MTALVVELERRLRDLATVHRELVCEHLALAERAMRAGDELERLADDLYADAQDDALKAAVA